MDAAIISTGIFLVILGFLVKSFPNLIAGYNSMSAEKKKRVDVESLSNYMRNALIIMGISIILLYYLFMWMGLKVWGSMIVIPTVLIGVFIIIAQSTKFETSDSKKKSLVPKIILLAAALWIVALFIYSNMPTKLKLNDNTISFSGMYGFNLNTASIKSVALIDSLPNLIEKINGLSLGAIQKGTFELEALGECYLLVQSDKPPYCLIKKLNGQKIIVNLGDKQETEALYKTCLLKIEKP